MLFKHQTAAFASCGSFYLSAIENVGLAACRVFDSKQVESRMSGQMVFISQCEMMQVC